MAADSNIRFEALSNAQIVERASTFALAIGLAIEGRFIAPAEEIGPGPLVRAFSCDFSDPYFRTVIIEGHVFTQARRLLAEAERRQISTAVNQIMGAEVLKALETGVLPPIREVSAPPPKSRPSLRLLSFSN